MDSDILKVKPQKNIKAKCVSGTANNKYIMSKKQVCQRVSKADNY